jgi:hypothetical protein
MYPLSLRERARERGSIELYGSGTMKCWVMFILYLRIYTEPLD